MTQCKACGGMYNSIQADGTLYFHRCPPLSLPELVDAVAKGKVVLGNGETPSTAIQIRTYERNGLRDENLPGTRPADAGKMKAAGAGVATVVDLASPVVVALP